MTRDDMIKDALDNFDRHMEEEQEEHSMLYFFDNVVDFYNKNKNGDDIIIWENPMLDWYASVNDMVNKLVSEGFEEKDIREAINSIEVQNIADTVYAYALIKQKIVTEQDGVYYITDMPKLLNYILTGKKWSDIGLSQLYGNINVASTDPVTSSPGATYYGLLLSIMCESSINDKNLQTNLPKLKEFYEKSGYMNNTPADLFEKYLKTGMGGEPMIVDYEKSIIEFANSNPEGFEQVKKDIRILYPTPTIWNSHCIATFDESGNKFYQAFEDKEIQQIAWSEYGFRTGITGGNYDVSGLEIGIPQNITSTVTSLKMDVYNQLIEYLKK